MDDRTRQLLFALGVVVFVAGLAGLASCGNRLRASIAEAENMKGSERWPTTPGQVLRSDVDEVEHGQGTRRYRSWEVSLAYGYEVDGVSHQSQRVRLAAEGERISGGGETSYPLAFPDQDEAEAFSARYPVGARLTVHHHPTRHDIACLVPGDPNAFEAFPMEFMAVGVYGIVLVAGAYLLVGYRKRAPTLGE